MNNEEKLYYLEGMARGIKFAIDEPKRANDCFAVLPAPGSLVDRRSELLAILHSAMSYGNVPWDQGVAEDVVDELMGEEQ